MTLFMLVPSHFAKTVKKTFSGEILFFLRLPKHVKKEEEKIAWYETELNKQVKHISKKIVSLTYCYLLHKKPRDQTTEHHVMSHWHEKKVDNQVT